MQGVKADAAAISLIDCKEDDSESLVDSAVTIEQNHVPSRGINNLAYGELANKRQISGVSGDSRLFSRRKNNQTTTTFQQQQHNEDLTGVNYNSIKTKPQQSTV